LRHFLSRVASNLAFDTPGDENMWTNCMAELIDASKRCNRY
jgi:hypothetical protein